MLGTVNPMCSQFVGGRDNLVQLCKPGITTTINCGSLYVNIISSFLCLCTYLSHCMAWILYFVGSEPIELLAEFKLLAEVLDLLESNLMVIGTQV